MYQKLTSINYIIIFINFVVCISSNMLNLATCRCNAGYRAHGRIIMTPVGTTVGRTMMVERAEVWLSWVAT